MKTKFFATRPLGRLLLGAALALPLFVSCNKDNPAGNGGNGEPPYFCEGKYLVLNNGNWGDNDASLGRWEDAGKTYYPGAFFGVNKQHLGDLGQDVLVYGSKVYLAVSGSKTIFVTDAQLRLISRINPDNCQPRHLESYDGKVYATLYEGYLAEIDTTTFQLRKVDVEDNPEGFAILGGKAYVANSGGMNYPDYGTTVSVVDLENFQVEKTLTVHDNPVGVWALGEKLFILSNGNYDYDHPDNYKAPKLQVYEGGSISDSGFSDVSMCAQYGDMLYILTGAYSSEGATVVKYSAGEGEQGSFFPPTAHILGAYSLSVTEDYLWVGTSNYKDPGEMQVWTREGQDFYASFGTQGLNPQKVVELPE